MTNTNPVKQSTQNVNVVGALCVLDFSTLKANKSETLRTFNRIVAVTWSLGNQIRHPNTHSCIIMAPNRINWPNELFTVICTNAADNIQMIIVIMWHCAKVCCKFIILKKQIVSDGFLFFLAAEVYFWPKIYLVFSCYKCSTVQLLPLKWVSFVKMHGNWHKNTKNNNINNEWNNKQISKKKITNNQIETISQLRSDQFQCIISI